MRITHYRFPDGTPENVLLSHGCGVVLKDGDEIFVDEIPDKYRYRVDHLNQVIVCDVDTARELLKKYGGYGWKERFDQNGNLIETTPIQPLGNNSQLKHNRL